MSDYISKHTTAIEDCSIGEEEKLTVKLATERGWSGFRIFPNGNLWAVHPDCPDGGPVPDYAQTLRDAAPELLAACEMESGFREINFSNYDEDDVRRLQDWAFAFVDAARAAIAKAKTIN